MPSDQPRRIPAYPAEWVILELLLDASDQAPPISELVTAIGNTVAVADALDTLQTAGLIGQNGSLAFLLPDGPDATG
jgi:hypothetical protein